MADENKEHSQNGQAKGNKQANKSSHPTKTGLYLLQLGFFAGLIWGFVRWVFFEMKFTLVLPGMLLDPFMKQSFLRTGWGHGAGIAAFIVLSIVAAFLYKVVLGKLRGPWPGAVYGLLWWALLFLGIGPLLGFIKPITEAGWNTLYTEACVFTLWGLFIGYSVAFEFTDEASREPIGAK
ncbi:YqhR family membrane protein [Paenibacillus sp. GCM10023252]|uniref:YqhR family membrane protein n=1 Tax=Paenibacillus sp. GCM10023252 TaxID=3252649 RepID=UPI00361DA9D3